MTPVLPGATIGVLGGGQLARMLALEARRLGYRIRVLDPDPECAASGVVDDVVVAAFEDADAALTLARTSDVITLDTEHIPADVLEALQPVRPVHPSAAIIATIQDRFRQREFLDRLGVPQPAHEQVDTIDGLRAAALRVGFPSVLKSRRAGYDGRGQARVETADRIEQAWTAIGRSAAVLEAFVNFEREISVVLARSSAGQVVFFPVAENIHRNHILHATIAPARIDGEVAERARAMAANIAHELGHVGTLAVEMFLLRNGTLLVNEVAPRTHNSGHFTLGCCATSQFEQHVRAICGLPLGDTSLRCPAVMVNLLGDLWSGDNPDWERVLSHPRVSLHLYQKPKPSIGRKMGHMIIADEDAGRALQLGEDILFSLSAAAARQ